MLEEFLEDRRIRGVSGKTLKWYECYLRGWMDARGRPEHGKPAALRGFLDGYSNGQTRRTAFVAVRAYEHWRAKVLGARCWMEGLGMTFAPAPEYPVLRQKQFEAVMGQLDLSDRGEWRDYVVYSLLWYTGARLDAIRLLRTGDMDLAGGTLTVSTKGGVRAAIALPRVAAAILGRWLRRKGHQGEAWVFPSLVRTGRPVSASWLSHGLPRLARAAGLTCRVWVHGLRHSCATRLVAEAGVSVARRQLLHRSISTTERYVHWDLREVQKAVERAWSAP